MNKKIIFYIPSIEGGGVEKNFIPINQIFTQSNMVKFILLPQIRKKIILKI